MDLNKLEKHSYTNRFGTEYELVFTKCRYYDNGNLAVLAYCFDEDDEFWEPYATVTVNIEPLDNEYEAAIDTNNLGNTMYEWLINQSLAFDAGYEIPSGFCLFPVVEFDHDWIDGLPDESEKQTCPITIQYRSCS